MPATPEVSERPGGAEIALPVAGGDQALADVVRLLLMDADFRAELEGLLREARRAEAVMVCHDADVVGAWERLADRLALLERAYVLWKTRRPGPATSGGAT
jgi:hypothetical protein